MFETLSEAHASVVNPTPKGGPGHSLRTLARAARIARSEGNHRKFFRIAILLGAGSLAELTYIIAGIW